MEGKSETLIKYEAIKGYSSDLFDNEEWAEFGAFEIGYNLANATLHSELEKANEKIDEIQRRYDIIMSEPNGMVRDTMIGSLFIGF